MPKINDLDDAFFKGERLDRIYAGDTLVWPEPERWTPWMLVGAGPAAAPAAWYVNGVTNYDGGDHQRPMWRHSLNTQRIQLRGLAKTTAELPWAWGLVLFNIDQSVIPRPTKGLMSMGLASLDATALWGGAFARFDLTPDQNPAYHSYVANLVLSPASNPLPVGVWIHFDCEWKLGEGA